MIAEVEGTFNTLRDEFGDADALFSGRAAFGQPG